MFYVRGVIILLLIAIIASFVTIFVNETIPQRSSYSYNWNVLDCNNLEPLKGCRHEIGHKMDDDLGIPSQTTAFAVATKAHVLVETRPMEVPDDTAILIILYPDSDPREVYAALYASVDGDISRLPLSLQAFYSTDPAYLMLYNCLSKPGLNLCGRSISYLVSQK